MKKTKAKNKNVKYFDSLHFRIWLYFAILTILILTGFWAVQAVILRGTFTRIKTDDLQHSANEIAKRYPNRARDEAYQQYLRDTAFSKDLHVVVFYLDYTVNETTTEVTVSEFRTEYIASQFYDEANEVVQYDAILGWGKYLTQAIIKDDFLFRQSTNNRNYLIYGKRLSGSSYLYVSTPLIDFHSITDLFKNQIIIATIACLVLSIVISWFISRRISRPISNFSRTAQRLAKGDFSVRFDGYGAPEMEELATTLNYATEEIGKTEALRRDLIANVTHDLRTPLTMVRAYAEMIRDLSGADEEKRKKHSQVIIDEADRLSSLVNDILDLSKLQSGTSQAEFIRVQLVSLINSVIDKFQVFSARDGYEFKVDAECEYTVIADAKRIEQVLYNLIGNAINYAGEDKRVVVALRDMGDKVRVIVGDNGNGIEISALDNVWDKYYRAEQRKRGVVGSGIGLSIVKSILLNHNSAFGVISKQQGKAVAFSGDELSNDDPLLTLSSSADISGHGTAFWFELKKADKQDVQ